MVLSTSLGEVAFYEAIFSAGLRFAVHPTIKRILNFYGICPAQLSPNAWRNIISMLVIWHFHRRHLSLNEFRCLYTLLKGPGSESGWLYFKARLGKNILKGPPNNVKGWKRRFFFISGDDWEFHSTIPREEGVVQVSRSWGAPGKQCNKVPVLSSTEEERFHQVFKKIGERRFKIPVIMNSRTFYKYFAPGRVEVSSSSDSTAEGDIRGEGDTRVEAAASMDHTSLALVSRAQILALAMSKRIQFSELAKVVAQKAATPSSKGVAKKIKTGCGAHAAPTRPPVIPREGSSARRTLVKALGPQALVIASAAMAEKILAGVILLADKEKVEKLTFDQVVTKFLYILGQGFLKSAFNQQAFAESYEMEMVRAQNRAIELEAALAKKKNKGKKAIEKIEARNGVVAKLEAVRGSASSYFGDGFDFCKRQLAHQYPNLGIDLEDVEMDQDFLAQEEIEAEKRATEDEGDGEASVEGKED
ncbi:hypothetical protein Acr_00g0075480 [Actinidia rufa]|uniref:Transposase (putative) gypsy type domain-containing protein n=1 Tax=Actinidia rufa TaxID=165716 RepID=A0A7J0DT79_9ERIC|nr:hypothetical protein Acr_00g0075480 [Actinidia rufa]